MAEGVLEGGQVNPGFEQVAGVGRTERVNGMMMLSVFLPLHY